MMEFSFAGNRAALFWRRVGLMVLMWFGGSFVGMGLMGQGGGESSRGVTAQMTPGKIRAGGYAVFTVTVEGGVASEMIEPELPVGVEVAGVGKSTSSGTTIINGRVSRSYAQSWQVTAPQAGTYVIPRQRLEVDGKEVFTNTVELTVVERDDVVASQYDPMLSIEVGKVEFYEGEKVSLTAALYVHRQTMLRRVGLIELPKDNFAIQRFPLQGEEGMTRVAGVAYRVLTFQSTLSALKPGKYKVGPATSEVIVEVPTADNPFPHPLFSQSEPQKLKPQSNEIEVTVLPLPVEGRPKSFHGVVGDFTIHLKAEPKELSVGEPVSVEMTIEGSGNFDAIVAPGLKGGEGEWKVYPAKRFNMGSKDVMVGEEVSQVGFNQVIIPQKQVTEVPSYEFSFFSPTKKEYVTLRTPPVPLKVKPSALQLAAEAAQAAAGVEVGEVESEKVPQATMRMTDILSASAEQSVWLGVKPLPWRDERVLRVSVVAGGFALLLLLGKLGAVMVVRRRNSPNAVYREIWSRLRGRGQSAAEFYAVAAKLIRLRGLGGGGVEEVLVKADGLNFGRDIEGAEAKLDGEEQRRVLRLLALAEKEAGRGEF